MENSATETEHAHMLVTVIHCILSMINKQRLLLLLLLYHNYSQQGTGTVHSIEKSRQLCQLLRIPVFHNDQR